MVKAEMGIMLEIRRPARSMRPALSVQLEGKHKYLEVDLKEGLSDLYLAWGTRLSSDVQVLNDYVKDTPNWEEIQVWKLKGRIASLDQTLKHLSNKETTMQENIRALRAVPDRETLLEENAKLRADLETAKQETARVKRWLSNVEAETITRFSGIGFVHKTNTSLAGIYQSLEG